MCEKNHHGSLKYRVYNTYRYHLSGPSDCQIFYIYNVCTYIMLLCFILRKIVVVKSNKILKIMYICYYSKKKRFK